MTSVWKDAIPKIESLIVDHKNGAHRGSPVTACPSCLFTNRGTAKSAD